MNTDSNISRFCWNFVIVNIDWSWWVTGRVLSMFEFSGNWQDVGRALEWILAWSLLPTNSVSYHDLHGLMTHPDTTFAEWWGWTRSKNGWFYDIKRGTPWLKSSDVNLDFNPILIDVFRYPEVHFQNPNWSLPKSKSMEGLWPWRASWSLQLLRWYSVWCHWQQSSVHICLDPAINQFKIFVLPFLAG